jgi:hypothetical protein
LATGGCARFCTRGNTNASFCQQVEQELKQSDGCYVSAEDLLQGLVLRLHFDNGLKSANRPKAKEVATFA